MTFSDETLGAIRNEPSLIRPTLLPKGCVRERVCVIIPEFLHAAFREAYEPKERIRFKTGTTIIYEHNGMSYVTPLFGAAHAAFVFENIIAAGGKEFIIAGSAGRLESVGSAATALVTEAFDHTGVRPLYSEHQKSAYDSVFLEEIASLAEEAGMPLSRGAIASVDTPYRETKTLLRALRAEGASLIDMEMAVFATIGAVKGLRSVGLALVSDELDEHKGNWKTLFKSRSFKEEKARFIDFLGAFHG